MQHSPAAFSFTAPVSCAGCVSWMCDCGFREALEPTRFTSVANNHRCCNAPTQGGLFTQRCRWLLSRMLIILGNERDQQTLQRWSETMTARLSPWWPSNFLLLSISRVWFIWRLKIPSSFLHLLNPLSASGLPLSLPLNLRLAYLRGWEVRTDGWGFDGGEEVWRG